MTTILSKVPETLHEKFVSLTMKPADWGELHRSVTPEDYRDIVLEYQANEFETMPRCKVIFGMCICYSHGHCTSKEFCHHQYA